MQATMRKYLPVWIGLGGFVALQATMTDVPLHGLSHGAALLLAWLMVALVVTLLMSWKRAPALAAMFALSGIFWSVILFGMGTGGGFGPAVSVIQQNEAQW